MVVTSTRETFQEMFDNDDTLAYEPGTTAAVVMCGGDEEAEAAAREVRLTCFCLMYFKAQLRGMSMLKASLRGSCHAEVNAWQRTRLCSAGSSGRLLL